MRSKSAILWLYLYYREMRNLVKESSVNTFSEGLTAVMTSPSNHFQLGYSFTWRDMAPTKDIDVERILNQHCSKPYVFPASITL